MPGKTPIAKAQATDQSPSTGMVVFMIFVVLVVAVYASLLMPSPGRKELSSVHGTTQESANQEQMVQQKTPTNPAHGNSAIIREQLSIGVSSRLREEAIGANVPKEFIAKGRNPYQAEPIPKSSIKSGTP